MKANTPKKVALYARVSTKDKGQDPEVQLQELRRYCEARGWQVYREYVDHGWSGAKENRPALNEMMVAARRRKFDLVLVWAFDRFARSVKQLVLALEEFKQLGIQFRSHTQDIDTTGPFGTAIFAVIAAMAQLERELYRERVLAGLQTAREKGVKLGRPRCNPDVAKIADLRSRGVPWREVVSLVGVSLATAKRALLMARKPISNQLQ